jgi:signal transduction histidine kinase
MTIVFEEADPGVVLQEAVNTAHSLAEMNGLKLSVQIQPQLPHLWLDSTRIRQVLFNLLNNAVRFTPQGTITVSVRSTESDVVFSVADTGLGSRRRIFPDCSRSSSSSTAAPGGGMVAAGLCWRSVVVS